LAYTPKTVITTAPHPNSGMIEYRINAKTLRIVIGDITEQDTDAIVNAANPSLMGGGGVDGAIHRKGGPAILRECTEIRERQYPRGLPTGGAVITTGGNLKARHIIHTVGPIWRGGKEGEPQQLARAYENSLRLAAERGLRTIAFPAISTGAYGYPAEKAAGTAIKTTVTHLQENTEIEEITLVTYTHEDYRTHAKVAEETLGDTHRH
jgi:O-acetyl-ADP-ribose deacetylase (regulator of RNase III)